MESGRTRVVTLGQVVAHGSDLLLADGNVDMDVLAERAAVSRATLYRVVGSRDRLLTEVVWSLTDRLLARSCREAEGEGIDRVLDVTRRFLDAQRSLTFQRSCATTRRRRRGCCSAPTASTRAW